MAECKESFLRSGYLKRTEKCPVVTSRRMTGSRKLCDRTEAGKVGIVGNRDSRHDIIGLGLGGPRKRLVTPESASLAPVNGSRAPAIWFF